MTTVFPGAIDSFPRPLPGTKRNAGSNLNLSTVIDNLSDATEAIETYTRTISRKNRLINGDLRVKQRAVMPVADNAYSLDGCRLLMESATGWTIAQETTDVPTGSPAAIKLTVGATNNAKGGVFIPIVNADMLDIRSAVASAQFKHKVSNARIGDIRWALIQRGSGTIDTFADPVSAWGAAGTNPTLTDGWAYITTPSAIVPTTSWSSAVKLENQAVSGSANALGLLIWCDDKTTTTGDQLLISGLQVERSAVCTDLDFIPYTQQLANCEHWLQVFNPALSTFPIVSFGVVLDATHSDFGPLMKRPMRASPLLTITPADWAVVISGGVNTLSAASLLHVGTMGVWFRGTHLGVGTAGFGVFLSRATGGGVAATDLILSSEP